MESHTESSSEQRPMGDPTLRQLRENAEYFAEEAWWTNLRAKPDTRDSRDPTTVGKELLARAFNDQGIRWKIFKDGADVVVPLSQIYDEAARHGHL